MVCLSLPLCLSHSLLSRRSHPLPEQSSASPPSSVSLTPSACLSLSLSSACLHALAELFLVTLCNPCPGPCACFPPNAVLSRWCYASLRAVRFGGWRAGICCWIRCVWMEVYSVPCTWPPVVLALAACIGIWHLVFAWKRNCDSSFSIFGASALPCSVLRCRPSRPAAFSIASCVCLCLFSPSASLLLSVLFKGEQEGGCLLL